jgi:hypothetical protein
MSSSPALISLPQNLTAVHSVVYIHNRTYETLVSIEKSRRKIK